MEKLLKLLFKIRAKIEKIIEIFSWQNLKNVFEGLPKDEIDATSKPLHQKEIEERESESVGKNNEVFEAKILGKFSPRYIDNSLQNFERIFKKNSPQPPQKFENLNEDFRGENGEKFSENFLSILKVLEQNFSPQNNNFFLSQDKKLTVQKKIFSEFQSDFFEENQFKIFNKISTLNNFFNEINFTASAQDFDLRNPTSSKFVNTPNSDFAPQISTPRHEDFKSVSQNSGKESPNFYADDFREIIANLVGDFIDTSLRINGFKTH